jgi:hypothetical protein
LRNNIRSYAKALVNDIEYRILKALVLMITRHSVVAHIQRCYSPFAYAYGILLDRMRKDAFHRLSTWYNINVQGKSYESSIRRFSKKRTAKDKKFVNSMLQALKYIFKNDVYTTCYSLETFKRNIASAVVSI